MRNSQARSCPVFEVSRRGGFAHGVGEDFHRLQRRECFVRVFAAVAAGEGKAGEANDWVAMAVATPGGHSPCGACRQVLVEFAPALPILLVDSDRPDSPEGVRETDMAALLPGRFIFSK
jgi:cytidine deaminase